MTKSEWLQVFERSEYCCQYCFDSEIQIELFYAGNIGRDIKSISSEKLKVICQNCLREERQKRPEAENDLLSALSGEFTYDDIHSLADAFRSLDHPSKFQHCPHVLTAAICWTIENETAQRNLIDSYFKHLEATRSHQVTKTEDIPF